ncbi:tetratricopeptide repeat protein [Sphingomonas aerolata]|uniref:tetratricopeptide repeat protein n=1 Tax=Sphingomonas aerolata TaxID=185951 RepID=UPI002FE34B25
MADVQARIGGAREARPWLERALAQTPADSRARAEVLEKLGRQDEAVRLVETLRSETPQDRSLAALHARLLITQGQPGRARTVLAQ